MAKRSSKYRHFSVMATQGGQLIAGSNSGDTAGAANYVEKVNFRRETDGEVRREGWEKLQLDNYIDNLGTNDPVRLVYQFLSEEELVLVAASGDKIYRLNESTESWVVIAEGLQYIDSPTHVVEPRRWEALSIDGYCIFNNGADLPLIYRNGWSCAYPIYGIRERGIIRCGTISEFDGRLWLADMTYIDEDNNPDAFKEWMQNATEPYGLPENESFSTPTYNSPHSIEYSAWRLADNISVAKASPYLFGQVYEGEVSVMNTSTTTSSATRATRQIDGIIYTNQQAGSVGNQTSIAIVEDYNATGVEISRSATTITISLEKVAATQDTLIFDGVTYTATNLGNSEATISMLENQLSDGVSLSGKNIIISLDGAVGNKTQGDIQNIWSTAPTEVRDLVNVVVDNTSDSLTTLPSNQPLVGGVDEVNINNYTQQDILDAYAVSSQDVKDYIQIFISNSNEFLSLLSDGLFLSGGLDSTTEQSGTLAEIKLPFELGGANVSNSLNPYHSSTAIDAGTIKVGDTIRMSIDTTPGSVPNYVVYDGVVSSLTLAGGETKISLISSAHNTESLTATGDSQTSVSIPQVGEPLQFILLKEPDTFSGDPDLQKESADGLSFPEDGSQILKMVKLADKLLVYRQTGYLAISRGNTQSAYFFEEKYRGERVADFRNTIITIDSQRQLFAGYNGVFIVTPAAVEPTPFQPHMMGPEFWRNITRQEIEYCWACENSLTQEIFIIAPVGIKLDDSTGMKLDWGVIAYDMIYGTLSQIDAAMTSACNLFPTPKISSRWFILSTHVVENESDMYTDSELLREEDKEFTSAGSKIMRYSYGPAVENIFGNTQPYRSFRRDGADYISRIKYGKNDFGDKFSEKMLRSYALHLSDRYDYTTYTRDGYVEDEFTKDLSATVSIKTYSTGVDDGDEEINEVLDSLDTETMVPLFAQGNYYQDTIELRGRDNGFKILGRTFEVSGVRTRHTNEAHEVSA